MGGTFSKSPSNTHLLRHPQGYRRHRQLRWQTQQLKPLDHTHCNRWPNGDTHSDISASTFYPLPKNFSSIPLSTMLKGHIPIEIELLNHSHNFRLVKSLFDRTISFGDSGLLFSSNLFEFEVQQLEWKQSRPAFSLNLVYLDLWHNILYGVIPTQVGLLTIARHILIKVLQCIDGIHSIRDCGFLARLT